MAVIELDAVTVKFFAILGIICSILIFAATFLSEGGGNYGDDDDDGGGGDGD